MLYRHGEREMRHTCIAGLLQDPGQRQLGIIADVADAMAIENKGMRVHHAVRLDDTLL